MSIHMKTRAIIADDEPNLLLDLRELLAEYWPDLEVCASVSNGTAALEKIEELKPDVAFLDIQMPGLSGIEVARLMRHRCLVVFITAFHEHAVKAFEQAAVDYLLKPVDEERLKTAINRIRERLREKDTNQRLETLLSIVENVKERPPDYLHYIRAGSRSGIQLIALNDVILLRAKDKYTTVVTLEGECLIRTPLIELVSMLDPSKFWQVHRAAIVNASRIESIQRTDAERLVLKLRGCDELVIVSRPFLHHFRQM